jgi:serine-type D-Ala-D-Ala carboxypeptidase/endopeptidase
MSADTIGRPVRRSKARRTRVLPCLFALILVCGLAPGAAEQRLPSNPAIAAIVNGRLGTKPGFGIVVGLYEGGATRIVAFGQSGNRDAPLLDGATLFEIGSITKTFTATLLADMVNRGEVRIDDPVSKYLPARVHVPGRNGKAITLLDLATQSSGLPRLPENLSPRDPGNPYADYTVTQLYDFLSGYGLPRDPGEMYEYSNLGFGLLGHALALRSGMSYEELVRTRVLDPLKMTETAITLTPTSKSLLAPGHDPEGRPAANWDIPTLSGAGALRSSVGDMLKYLGAQLGAAPRELARAVAMRHVVRRSTNRVGVEIALAWHVLHRSGHDIVWHNGGTGGYHSFIGFEPKRASGVVLLSNSSANFDDIGIHLLDEGAPLASPKQ